jgi:hypothetical protein
MLDCRFLKQVFIAHIFYHRFYLAFTILDSGEVCYQNLNNAQYSRVVRDLLLLFRYRLELYEFNDGTKKYYLKSKVFLLVTGH